MWYTKVSWDLVNLEREVRKHEEREEAARDGIFFTQRAIYRSLLVYNSVFYDLDDVIADLDKAIEIGDIRSLPYRLLGLFLLMKLTECPTTLDAERKQILARVRADYQVALEREPTDGFTWLCKIEAGLLSHDWDEAITIYGESRPYVQTPEEILIWSLLGCIALALAGETIDEEDARPLTEAFREKGLERGFKEGVLGPLLVRLRTLLLDGLRTKPGYGERWRTANEIVRRLFKELNGWPEYGAYRCCERYKQAIELRSVNEELANLLKQARLLAIMMDGIDNEVHTKGAFPKLTNTLALNMNTIKARPYEAAARYESAMILDQLERYDEALEFLDKVIDLEPDQSALGGSARFAKANLLTKQKRHVEALKALGDVIRGGGTDMMVQALAWLKKAEVFMDMARKAEKEYGVTGEYANDRGPGANERRLREDALLAWEGAIAVRPNFAEAWLGKAEALINLGRHEEALEAYDKAILARPYYAILGGVTCEAWMRKADLLQKQLHRYEEAIGGYDFALDLTNAGRTSYLEILGKKVKMFKKLNRYEEAAAALYESAQRLMGEKETSTVLNLLKIAIDWAPDYKERVLTDKVFEALWDDPDFKKKVE